MVSDSSPVPQHSKLPVIRKVESREKLERTSNVSKSPAKKKKEPTAREKALEFAKNVPKPKPPRKESPKKELFSGSPQKEEFNKLEEKHEMYAAEMEQLKRDYIGLI